MIKPLKVISFLNKLLLILELRVKIKYKIIDYRAVELASQKKMDIPQFF